MIFDDVAFSILLEGLELQPGVKKKIYIYIDLCCLLINAHDFVLISNRINSCICVIWA